MTSEEEGDGMGDLHMWSYWWKRHNEKVPPGQRLRVVGTRTEEDDDFPNSPSVGPPEFMTPNILHVDNDGVRVAMRRAIDVRKVVEDKASIHDLLEVSIRLVHAMVEIRRKTDGLDLFPNGTKSKGFSFLHHIHSPEKLCIQSTLEGEGEQLGCLQPTILHAAAAYGCTRLLLVWLALAGTREALMKQDWNMRGWTPLHYAVSKDRVDCVRRLLSFNVVNKDSSVREVTPLFYASSAAVTALFIEHGMKRAQEESGGSFMEEDLGMQELRKAFKALVSARGKLQMKGSKIIAGTGAVKEATTAAAAAAAAAAAVAASAEIGRVATLGREEAKSTVRSPKRTRFTVSADGKSKAVCAENMEGFCASENSVGEWDRLDFDLKAVAIAHLAAETKPESNLEIGEEDFKYSLDQIQCMVKAYIQRKHDSTSSLATKWLPLHLHAAKGDAKALMWVSDCPRRRTKNAN